MHRQTTSFNHYWGKARPAPDAVAPFHPAWAHGLDVAAAGRALARARPGPFRTIPSKLGWSVPEFEAFWLHLLALHDLGKFSPLFQRKTEHGPSHLSPPRSAETDPGHPKAGLLLLGGLLDGEGQPAESALFRDWPTGARNRMLQPIFGHHGRPVPVPPDWQPGDWRPLFQPAEAAQAAVAYWEAVEALLPAPDLGVPRVSAISSASWALAGLTALADWIGSNQKWFPYVPADTPFAAYWERACRQAEEAVREAGLWPARPAARLTFAALTGIAHPPTAAQFWADTADVTGGPVLALIEDVTGGGKTEAALTMAHRLLASGEADGVFFALPTMATADAMFERIKAIASRLYWDETRPSLVLAHGRADLQARFRRAAEGFGTVGDAADGQDEEPDSAAVATAWLASENRKALLADLGIGTVDQAVLAVLPNRYGQVRLAGLSGKVLIVDEAHSFDSYLGRELETLVAFHAAGGGSTIILSATLPKTIKTRIAEAWRSALNVPGMVLRENSYPLATLLTPLAEPVEEPLAARPDLCRALTITRVPDSAAAIARIRTAAEAGACVAWLRNSVDDAIEGVASLREIGLAPDLFHARFAMADRLAIGQRVLSSFGKASTPEGRRGRVIVSTQVLEASLDVCFDLIVTDLAPIDSIIQRAGRLWRHTSRTRPIAGPELVVVSPDPAGPVSADWMLSSSLPRTAAVYRDHAILWRTARELFARPRFRVPEDVRPAIEAVYDLDDADIPADLERIRNEAIGAAGAERSVADQNLLVFSEGYWPDGRGWQQEGGVSTRLAEETRRLRLARAEGGRLVPWHADPDPKLAWALSEVVAYERKLRGRHLPEPRWQPAAAAARAGWGRFEEDVVLVPVEESADRIWTATLLDPEGGRLEVSYSTGTGLVL